MPPQQPECPRLGAEGVCTWGLGYYFIKEAGGVPTCGRSNGNGEISKGEASPKVKSCFVVHLLPCPDREFPPLPAFEDRTLFLTQFTQEGSFLHTTGPTGLYFPLKENAILGSPGTQVRPCLAGQVFSWPGVTGVAIRWRCGRSRGWREGGREGVSRMHSGQEGAYLQSCFSISKCGLKLRTIFWLGSGA